MRNTTTSLLIAVFVASAIVESRGEGGNWPQWRGPLGTGVSPKGDPPVEWSEEKNVHWKVALPGRGHSTPIIWGDRIFLTAAVPFGPKLPPRRSGRPGAHDNLAVTYRHRFVALAVDREIGKTLWEKKLHDALPEEGAHYTASLASASPVADDEHVFVFFGSHGLFCLDHDGNVVWQKQLGQMETKHGHGEGTSPVLHGKTLVINWDHEGQSFIAAFDKATGKQLWRKQRDEVTSWSTPIVVERNGIAQVIVCGTARVRGYDLSNGKVLWECGGLSANIVASPVFHDGVVIVGSSYEIRSMLAIDIDKAKEDITNSAAVLWSRRRGTPSPPRRASLEFRAAARHAPAVVAALKARARRGRRVGVLQGRLREPLGAREVRLAEVHADGAFPVREGRADAVGHRRLRPQQPALEQAVKEPGCRRLRD